MTDREEGDVAEIRCVGRALDLLEIMQRTAPAGIRVCDAAATLGIDSATARPESDRRVVRQALQREWREFPWYI
jgi:hypothetical protein